MFTRSQIVDAIRGENYAVTQRSIDVVIVGLRKKLKNYASAIETIRARLLQKSFSDSLKVDLNQTRHINEQCKEIGETTGTKDFAANVSHELKTPLTTIKGFIETLQKMLTDNNTRESENFLKVIEKNVNRMIELINDLLSLSKLERLEGTLIQFENQHLATLIQGIVNTCHAGIQKNIYQKFSIGFTE